MKKLIIIICCFSIQPSLATSYPVDFKKVAKYIKHYAYVRPISSHDRFQISEIFNMKLITRTRFLSVNQYLQFSVLLSNGGTYNDVYCSLAHKRGGLGRWGVLIISNCDDDRMYFEWLSNTLRISMKHIQE